MGVVGLGRDGVVAFEDLADPFGGNGALPANAPEVATKLDNGGRQGAVGRAGIEDEGDAVAELAEDFVASLAVGPAGNVGTGASERDAEFADEGGNNFAIGPAQTHTARVGGNLQGQPVGSVHNDGEPAGPAGFGETVEIVWETFGEHQGLSERTDENGKRAGFRATFDAKNVFDGGKIDRIGGERVARVGGNSNDRAAIQPARSVSNDPQIGVDNINVQNLSRQSKYLLCSGAGASVTGAVKSENNTSGERGAMREKVNFGRWVGGYRCQISTSRNQEAALSDQESAITKQETGAGEGE